MKRKAEPELMKRREQVIAYSEGDFNEGENNFIKFINNYLKNNRIKLSNKDLIVDLGCGPGNITEKLSINWPHVNVLGIDGSEEMILKAKSNKNKKELFRASNNLNYLCADVKKITLKDISAKKVSLLVSNSLIHHINHLDQFFEFLLTLSTKETINFHKDLIRPNDKKTAIQLKAKCLNEFSSILADDFYASLLASYTREELKNKVIEKKLFNMDVIQENNKYLILYGKV